MTARTRAVRGAAASAALAAAALALTGIGPAGPVASGAAARTHVRTPAMGVRPHLVRAGQAHPGGRIVFACQSPRARITCYGPDQMRAAYAVQPLLDAGLTGKGRTIVVVDAYSPPAVAADLAAFDRVWGLTDPSLTIVAPQGATPWDGTDAEQVGWAGETDLDVQWAHAIAPDARIVLVQARSSDDADILAATRWAVDHGVGDVISQSFGEDERCVDPRIDRAQHEVFERATRRGITLLASSGDQGSAQATCDGTSFSLAASSPAVDPLVTAVGGTSLDADPVSGTWNGEKVWNESATFGVAGGGGLSTLVRRPGYQSHVVRGRFRAVPDVAYDAGIDGGVIAYLGDAAASGPGSAGFYLVGGTSAGSPQWAGLVAIAAQAAHRRLGALNDTLYRLGRSRRAAGFFHDVTVGDNAFSSVDASGATVSVAGYPAGPGWDAATGWGSPNASALVPALARAARDDHERRD